MLDAKNVVPVVYRNVSAAAIEKGALEFYHENGFWFKRNANLNRVWEFGEKTTIRFKNIVERNHWCIAYIRHNCSNYDFYLKVNGIFRSKDGENHPMYKNVKDIYLRLIREKYPKYFTPDPMLYGMAC